MCEQVDVERHVPVGIRRRQSRPTSDARVRDVDVDSTEPALRKRDGRIDVRRRTRIPGQRRHVLATRINLGRCALERVVVEVGGNDPSPTRDERTRDGGTDTASRACDDRNISVDVHRRNRT